MGCFQNDISDLAKAFPEMPRQLQKFTLKPYNSFGVRPGGQGVEPPVRMHEKLVCCMGGIKVRLGYLSLIYLFLKL